MRVALVLALALAGCGAGIPRPATSQPRPCTRGDAVTLSPELTLSCIAPSVWLFTALAPESFELPGYPANGLVVESFSRTPHAVLVDTAWNDAQADALASWAAARGTPVTAAIATHSHDDRVGGAAGLQARHVPVYALDTAIARARTAGGPVPDHALAPGDVPEVQWLFPGAAHSPDNVVVWHAATRTLYGGCMVKSADAPSLGNVADADVAGWPAALDHVEAAFPSPALVVPGHGAVGDASLLAHTRALARAAAAAATAAAAPP